MAYDLDSPVAQAFMQEGSSRGYTPMQIAAVLGRGTAESGGDPTNSTGDGGTSGGVLQWHADRLDNLKNFAAQNNASWTDPAVQAKFAFNEMEGPEAKAGGMLKSAQTPTDALAAIHAFERPQGYSASNPSASMGYDTAASSMKNFMGQMAAKGIDLGSAQDWTPTGSIGGGKTQAAPSNLGFTNVSGTPGQQPYQESFGDKLAGIGAILAATGGNSGLASTLQNGLNQRMQLAKMMQDAQTSANTWTAGKTFKAADGKYYDQRTNDKTGQTQYQLHTGPVEEEEDETKIPDRNVHQVMSDMQNNDLLANKSLTASNNIAQLAPLIAQGRVKFGVDAKTGNFFANATNQSDESAQAAKDIATNLNAAATAVVTSEKGAASKAKLDQAKANFIVDGGDMDAAQTLSALGRVTDILKDTHAPAAQTNIKYLNKYQDNASAKGTIDPVTGKDRDYKWGINDYNNQMKQMQANRDVIQQSLNQVKAARGQQPAQPGLASSFYAKNPKPKATAAQVKSNNDKDDDDE